MKGEVNVMTCRFLALGLILLLPSCQSPQPARQSASTTEPAPQQKDILDVTGVERMIADPEASRAATDSNRGAYAWQLFIYFNLPLTGTDSKVWEKAFRQTSTVYLSTGCEPPAWGQATPLPSEVQAQANAMAGGVAPTQVWHNLDTSIQVDGLVLPDIWKQDVRYQLLVNRPAFEYIVQRQFYNVEGQEKAAQDNDPADFPPASFELKTSWIWIGKNADRLNQLKPSYYIAPAYYEVVKNGRHVRWEVGYAALSGMHIINKSQPKWVWITFENVNNPTFTPPVKLELQIPDYAVQANQAYQQALRNINSVFANYQLDGVQLDFQDPTLLANSHIESAFQSQSSCMTCHATASITKDGKYFNIVDKSGGNIGYYTGTPPSLSGYTQLDFVWSMKRASRKNNNCP